jgi:hypothetical protein
VTALPAGGAVHGQRWNEAEPSRLELAKSGPSAADVSVEILSGDSSAFAGLWRAFFCFFDAG